MENLVKVIILYKNPQFINSFFEYFKLLNNLKIEFNKKNKQIEFYYPQNILFNSNNLSFLKSFKSKNIHFIPYKNGDITLKNIEKFFLNIQPQFIISNDFIFNISLFKNINTLKNVDIYANKNNTWLSKNGAKPYDNLGELFVFIQKDIMDINENINYISLLLKSKENKNKVSNASSDSETLDFCNQYKTNPKSILKDKKMEFRFICYKCLPSIQNLNISHEIQLNNKYEAVIIEFRCFPHIELLIINTIIKLGSNWSHSVVCGNSNYTFIKNICDKISPNIKIIKIDCNDMPVRKYNELLLTVNFWSLFSGEKILIYQDDTYMFKNNINDFIKYDYIGAPWPKQWVSRTNIKCVGNGGFSLRTKQCMIDSLTKDPPSSTIIPEDVYFSKTMINNNIGIVADWDTAKLFSTECICDRNSFGGHCFWVSDSEWKNRLYNDIMFKI